MSSLKNKIELIERGAIIDALRDCDWIQIQVRAAKVLGITERMIGYKKRKYKIIIDKNPEETVNHSFRVITNYLTER